jgi:hypothetical protein
MYIERAEALFLWERRRSKRIPRAIARGAQKGEGRRTFTEMARAARLGVTVRVYVSGVTRRTFATDGRSRPDR